MPRSSPRFPAPFLQGGCRKPILGVCVHASLSKLVHLWVWKWLASGGSRLKISYTREHCQSSLCCCCCCFVFVFFLLLFPFLSCVQVYWRWTNPLWQSKSAGNTFQPTSDCMFMRLRDNNNINSKETKQNKNHPFPPLLSRFEGRSYGHSRLVGHFEPVLKSCTDIKLGSSWYNCIGWLGVKRQVTYLTDL